MGVFEFRIFILVLLIYIYIIGFIIIAIDLAGQLDEGKGLSRTVADIKDANKRGALHFAAREGQTEVCKYLLEELKLDVDSKDEEGICLILCIVYIRYVLHVLFDIGLEHVD